MTKEPKVFIKVSKQTGEVFDIPEMQLRLFLIDYAKSFRHPNCHDFARSIIYSKLASGQRFETPAYLFFADKTSFDRWANSFGSSFPKKYPLR